jgi:hypothetical protein
MTHEHDPDRRKIRWCSPEKPPAEQRLANANRQQRQKKLARAKKRPPRET